MNEYILKHRNTDVAEFRIDKESENVDIKSYIKHMPNMVDIFDKAFEKYENAERKDAIRKALKIKQIEVEKRLI